MKPSFIEILYKHAHVRSTLLQNKFQNVQTDEEKKAIWDNLSEQEKNGILNNLYSEMDKQKKIRSKELINCYNEPVSKEKLENMAYYIYDICSNPQVIEDIDGVENFRENFNIDKLYYSDEETQRRAALSEKARKLVASENAYISLRNDIYENFRFLFKKYDRSLEAVMSSVGDKPQDIFNFLTKVNNPNATIADKKKLFKDTLNIYLKHINDFDQVKSDEEFVDTMIKNYRIYHACNDLGMNAKNGLYEFFGIQESDFTTPEDQAFLTDWANKTRKIQDLGAMYQRIDEIANPNYIYNHEQFYILTNTVKELESNPNYYPDMVKIFGNPVSPLQSVRFSEGRKFYPEFQINNEQELEQKRRAGALKVPVAGDYQDLVFYKHIPLDERVVAGFESIARDMKCNTDELIFTDRNENVITQEEAINKLLANEVINVANIVNDLTRPVAVNDAGMVLDLPSTENVVRANNLKDIIIDEFDSVEDAKKVISDVKHPTDYNNVKKAILAIENPNSQYNTKEDFSADLIDDIGTMKQDFVQQNNQIYPNLFNGMLNSQFGTTIEHLENTYPITLKTKAYKDLRTMIDVVNNPLSKLNTFNTFDSAIVKVRNMLNHEQNIQQFKTTLLDNKFQTINEFNAQYNWIAHGRSLLLDPYKNILRHMDNPDNHRNIHLSENQFTTLANSLNEIKDDLTNYQLSIVGFMNDHRGRLMNQLFRLDSPEYKAMWDVAEDMDTTFMSQDALDNSPTKIQRYKTLIKNYVDHKEKELRDANKTEFSNETSKARYHFFKNVYNLLDIAAPDNVLRQKILEKAERERIFARGTLYNAVGGVEQNNELQNNQINVQNNEVQQQVQNNDPQNNEVQHEEQHIEQNEEQHIEQNEEQHIEQNEEQQVDGNRVTSKEEQLRSNLSDTFKNEYKPAEHKLKRTMSMDDKTVNNQPVNNQPHKG